MISAGAKKRLTRAITLLIESNQPKRIYNEVAGRIINHRLSFITLTVSDTTKNLTAKEAHELLLSHFLQWLRRTKKVTTYIWKAELQKRGQIHYHITTPSFINWQEIKDKWNNLQSRNGLLDKYYSEHKHYNANSTDIHAVRKINDLGAYLIKYFTKAEQNAKSVGGKTWDCSDNLKSTGYFKTVMTSFHHDFLIACVEQGVAELYEQEKFSIYKFKERPHNHLLSDREMELYNIHLNKLRNNIQLQITSDVIELAPTKDYNKTVLVTDSKLATQLLMYQDENKIVSHEHQ